MKKYSIIFLFLLITIGTFTSCDSSLNVASQSSLTDDVIYSNVDLTEGAIGAIYDIVGQNNSYRNRLWLQMGVNTDIEYRTGWSSTAPLVPSKSDDYFALYTSTTLVADGYNNTDSANPWSLLFAGIERANLAIAGITKYGNPTAGSTMGHFLGEALTMRAYYYYDLIKWWGDVPARFEPVSSATIYLAKSNRDTIYNHIITDLQTAIPLLYASGNNYTKTIKRTSKDAARGLLARICLSAAGYSMRPSGTDAVIQITATPDRQKELYTIAREACRSIISGGKYSLDASFKNIFYQQCQDIDTHGREAIWELPYNMGTRGRMVTSFGLPRANDGVYITGNQASVGGQFKIIPSFFYDYNPADTRRDVTIVPYSIARNSALVKDSTLNVQTLGSLTSMNLAKWRAEWVKTPISSTEDGVSPIILRYADVLLMFAEADLFLGGSEGSNYFNMVRRRAFGQPINSVSSYDLPLTLDNIKQERAFEFCGENIRKYDLERWGVLKSKIDQAEANMNDLRNSAGNYVSVPQTIYWRLKVNNAITHGERELEIYGLNPGELTDKTVSDPNGGWTKKTWISPTSLVDGFIQNMYLGDPDKRQLLPIMHQIIITSNGTLTNDYGYGN
jgi:hypothetical protein